MTNTPVLSPERIEARSRAALRAFKIGESLLDRGEKKRGLEFIHEAALKGNPNAQIMYGEHLVANGQKNRGNIFVRVGTRHIIIQAAKHAL